MIPGREKHRSTGVTNIGAAVNLPHGHNRKFHKVTSQPDPALPSHRRTSPGEAVRSVGDRGGALVQIFSHFCIHPAPLLRPPLSLNNEAWENWERWMGSMCVCGGGAGTFFNSSQSCSNKRDALSGAATEPARPDETRAVKRERMKEMKD